MSITRRQVVQLAGASPLLASAVSRCLAQAAAPAEPPRIITGSAQAGLRITNAPVVIPPKGKFRSIPLVAPMVIPPFYKLYDARVNITTWSDGALVRNGGSKIATMICGGAGHEPSYKVNNTQGNLALEVEVGKPATMSWRNAPAFPASDNDGSKRTETDLALGLMANHRLKNTHAYQSFEAIPEDWGLGKNLVFRFRATGIPPTDTRPAGNRICIYDISKPEGGEYLLSDEPVAFDATGKNKGNAYVMICRDDVRKGFWVSEPYTGKNSLLVTPFLNAEGKFRATLQYWPSIVGNAGNGFFHIPDLDWLVCVCGGAFRGNYGAKYFAYLTIMSPGATPADAKIWNIGYAPEVGKFWPNAIYDGWYGNAKQIDAFTLKDKGAGYLVGDKIKASVVGPLLCKNGIGKMVNATIAGVANLTVMRVGGGGSVEELAFQTALYQGVPFPLNGYFSAESVVATDGTANITNGQTISMVLSGTAGSGATIDCVMQPALSAMEVQKLGLAWVPSRKAAYGWLDNPGTGKVIPIKLAMPADPADKVTQWVMSSPAIAHDETDVAGEAVIVPAQNGTYRKTRYWPEQDVWLRFVSVERNPQIISMD